MILQDTCLVMHMRSYGPLHIASHLATYLSSNLDSDRFSGLSLTHLYQMIYMPLMTLNQTGRDLSRSRSVSNTSSTTSSGKNHVPGFRIMPQSDLFPQDRTTKKIGFGISKSRKRSP